MKRSTLLTALLAMLASPAPAATYTVIHDFSGAGDGRYPLGDLVVDGQGQLYGTTYGGNPNGDGDVFMLVPPAKGSKTWSEKILHQFGGSDGAGSQAGVLLGASGEVYGTNSFGGAYDYGNVYRLGPNGMHWTLTTLHDFKDPTIANDGGGPLEGLAFGKDGNLAGTTFDGGDANQGTVFSLSPMGDASFYAVLHSFGVTTKDGDLPYPGRLAIDKRGELFGTTALGGVNARGIAYRLTPSAKKGWTEKILRSFEGEPNDVTNPPHGVALDKNGVVYGCASGGANDMGAVYALAPSGKTWVETILYAFGDQPNDPGVSVNCGVVVDPSGKIFGVTSAGGQFGFGAFFELDPPAHGQTAWTETVLHSFGDGTDGQLPVSPPVKWKHSWYGTASAGGTGGAGVAYEITP